MGSYDGAESRELVGPFLLHQISEKHGKNFGPYRDDGLGVAKATPRETEMIKKDLCSIFNKRGLKITIEANKRVVDFLDVTLNLSTAKYQPFIKPNNVPLYVHDKSNHPPKILESIPPAINRRLSEISSDVESFQRVAPLYQEALSKSGYQHELKFQVSQVNNCNCRKQIECPLPKNCLAESVIYQATVNTSDKRHTEACVELTENKSKTRYANHKASFSNILKQNCTELSKHIWNLNQKNIEYSIRWRILKQDKSYSNVSKSCNLCRWEKYFIICKPNMATLNRRNELVSTCRHANKFPSKNFKS